MSGAVLADARGLVGSRGWGLIDWSLACGCLRTGQGGGKKERGRCGQQSQRARRKRAPETNGDSVMRGGRERGLGQRRNGFAH